MKRLEGESFEDYRARRKADREATDKHLAGTLVVPRSGSNRATRRARSFVRKGWGKQSKWS